MRKEAGTMFYLESHFFCRVINRNSDDAMLWSRKECIWRPSMKQAIRMSAQHDDQEPIWSNVRTWALRVKSGKLLYRFAGQGSNDGSMSALILYGITRMGLKLDVSADGFEQYLESQRAILGMIDARYLKD